MKFKITRVEDYKKFIGSEAVDRILSKAKLLKDLSVVNINSTYYGGGVAEILTSLTLLLNSLGIRTEWRVIQGTPDFFNITKKMHNALQGGVINLTKKKKEIYERVNFENSMRNFLNHDFVIVHDPQPLPFIKYYKEKSCWIWRCHIDLTNPNKKLLKYLTDFIEEYDAIIMSSKDFAQNFTPPLYFMVPAINPFNIKNRHLSDEEIEERLVHYKIPTDIPIVAQISRFDPWKDPMGVIEAYRIARKEVDFTLVLLGNFATDDPEGSKIYEELINSREHRIVVLPYGNDTALVNALQRKAHVVVQKSLREGFGLTVTEAMWKGTPVIGGNVGGIRYQINDGQNGYLVSSVEETAQRIVQILNNNKLRIRLGKNAKETVKKDFLLTRYLEQYLDLFTVLSSKN